MLNNPLWDKGDGKQVPCPKLSDMVAWLEKQPPKTKYDFKDVNGQCLAGRYLTANRIDYPAQDWSFSCMFGGRSYHSQLERYYAVAAVRPWTYGAALERAKNISA
jgi:hypothetical protein